MRRPIFWNYGFVPQTWENPDEKDSWTGYYGDGDPLDVVEIGSVEKDLGDVSARYPSWLTSVGQKPVRWTGDFQENILHVSKCRTSRQNPLQDF